MSEPDPLWREFERSVAQLFRDAGARQVIHNYDIGGRQIDVYALETTPMGAEVRTLIEAKDYAKPVTMSRARQLTADVEPLQRQKLVDRVVMVSARGFAKDTRRFLETADVEALEFKDLEASAGRANHAVSDRARAAVTAAGVDARMVREQLRTSEQLSMLDFDDMTATVAKTLENLSAVLTHASPPPRLGSRDRRIRAVVANVEDDLERSLDVLTYWRRVTALIAERDAGALPQPQDADATSARLVLMREGEQARASLRTRLRAVEDTCSRAPWLRSV